MFSVTFRMRSSFRNVRLSPLVLMVDYFSAFLRSFLNRLRWSLRISEPELAGWDDFARFVAIDVHEHRHELLATDSSGKRTSQPAFWIASAYNTASRSNTSDSVS